MKNERQPASMTFHLPQDSEVHRVLRVLKGDGQSMGHWVLKAIRERMQREGLLPVESKR